MISTKTLLATLALSITTTIGAVAVPIPEDAKIEGFAIGAQAYTFKNFTAVEAVEKTAHAGAKAIEFYPGQKFSASNNAAWGHDASDEMIAEMKELLKKHGVRAVNYGVVGIPNNEERARKIFEFAKKMDLYAITTESTESIDVIEKLVKEYDIKVGFHNHPQRKNDANYKVWSPAYIRDLVKNRDKRIGAAADVGHWATDGQKAVEGLKILDGRIISLHAKDRVLLGKASENLPLGAGAINFGAVLDELKRQKFEGSISIEHESNWKNNVPEVASGIGFVRGYATAKGGRR